ncbi:MAG TPA: DoxX family protein [Pyrinomonadaceae bacterium]|nr:DoxX family protein [Pyrinomonadaceae bacterium]
MNVILWILQILLAILFVIAGVPKLILPASMLKAPPGAIEFPVWFLRFIGVCELLGGLGLLLPAVFKRRQSLIPLAAAGLLVIMIGATVTTVMSGGGITILIPLVSAVLLAFVAYGRSRLLPHR